MADSIQLPQDLLNIRVNTEYDQDLLRKLLTDLIIEIEELKTRIESLENGV